MSGPFGSSQWMYKSEEYEVANSCAFSDGNQDYLKRTPGSASNRRTWTWSSWLKRSRNDSTHMVFFTAPAGDLTEDDHFGIRFDSGTANLIITWGDGNVGVSASTHRDSGAWFHLVVAIDTTQGTDTDRIKAYINGEAVSFGSTDLPSQNHQYGINKAQEHNIGSRVIYGSSANYFDGYMAEINFVDGSQLTPSSFGETGTYDQWKPKEYTGSHGTNGFYLDFADASDLGDDESGNGNDWTEVNISARNQMPDSPTNNFCTFQEEAGFGVRALTSSGKRYDPNGGTGYLFGNMGVSTGKWYFEVCHVTAGNGYHTMIANDTWNAAGGNPASAGSYALYAGTYFYSAEGNINLGFGSPGSNGDIYGCAFDLDNDKIWFAKNGSWYNSGNPANGTNQTQDMDNQPNRNVRIATSHGNASYTGRYELNTGQDSSFSGVKTAQGNADSNGIGDFYYTPPSGFLAICSANLSAPAVVPNKNFNTILYTGTGSSASHTLGFRPNLVWGKKRNAGQNHWLINDVGDVNKWLATDNSNNEGTEANGTTFDANGFTTASNDLFYNNGGNYVVWAWKGNGTGTAVSNTSGSINSTVSANTSAGISIINFQGNATSGATFGHGLSSAPELVIIKNRDTDGYGWLTGFSALTGGFEKYLALGTTGGVADDTNIWNDTAPSSTLITLGSDTFGNKNGDDHICFAFHSVEGFSQFGTYKGNGNADGPFVYTGFRPEFIIVKSTAANTPWMMFDNKRDTDNPVTTYLLTYSNAQEGSAPSSNAVDFTSSGFKQRQTHADMNSNNVEYVYLAFAETPLKYANAR